MQKLLTFFSKNISIYAIFNDQRFNNTLKLMTLLILNKLAQDMEWPENYLTVFYLITIHTPISAQ